MYVRYMYRTHPDQDASVEYMYCELHINTMILMYIHLLAPGAAMSASINYHYSEYQTIINNGTPTNCNGGSLGSSCSSCSLKRGQPTDCYDTVKATTAIGPQPTAIPGPYRTAPTTDSKTANVLQFEATYLQRDSSGDCQSDEASWVASRQPDTFKTRVKRF